MNNYYLRKFLKNNRQLIQITNPLFLTNVLLLSSVDFLLLDRSGSDVRESDHYQDFYSRELTILATRH